MSHVRIQRFGSSYGQHDRAEYQKAAGGILGKEVDGITGRKRRQDLRILDDVDNAQQRQYCKPDKGDRSK